MSQELIDLEMTLLGLPRHPDDNNNQTAMEMVQALPWMPDEVVLVIAHEIELAKARRTHKSFEGFHEYRRVKRGQPNPIIADFLADGIYHRPSPEQLHALCNAALAAYEAMKALRLDRKIQSMIKADGVTDFEFDAGIL